MQHRLHACVVSDRGRGKDRILAGRHQLQCIVSDSARANPLACGLRLRVEPQLAPDDGRARPIIARTWLASVRRFITVAREDRRPPSAVVAPSHREVAKLPRPRAARHDLRTISHLHLQPRGVVRHQRADVIQIHDMRTVDAKEFLGIEPPLQVAECDVHEEAPAAGI